ncbi:sugar ABC transporter permease [Shinella sp. 838]|uniref:carbohydrate ABC transporter permease n=2 Tax=Shinella TaxID=323620 RepID=UPI0003C54DE4|nr:MULTISPECIES: sugar ABC transporter permease [unclassified Shinella]EYR83869.1 ABC-type sugar transport system permease component [Shinella sp. DD12]MDG4674979.1 sugar ABC transporter permease [Shinella sp. 838]
MPLRQTTIQRAERSFILWMLAPATILMLSLTLVPFLVSVYLSFTDYSLTAPDTINWVGLKNYSDLLSSADFWDAARITAIFTIVAVGIETVLGVGIAALLHHEVRQASWLRVIYLLPMAITPIAATFTFRLMFNPTQGVLNYMLGLMGVSPSAWTAAPETALLSLILVDVWQWTPFILLIVMGGMAALPPEPEEASQMDGAGPFRTFFLITLPRLKPYLALALLFRLIDAFKTFDIIFVLTGGGPGVATRTLNLLAYKYGIEFLSMGYASALAIVMLVFTLVAGQVFLRRLGLFDLKDYAP